MELAGFVEVFKRFLLGGGFQYFWLLQMVATHAPGSDVEQNSFWIQT